MKYLYFKDYKQRCRFRKTEQVNRILKSICLDRCVKKELRQKLYNNITVRLQKSTRVRINNRCVFTNRSHGILRQFQIERTLFRNSAMSGLISGLRTGFW